MSEKPALPDNLRELALAAQSRVKKLGATAPLADMVSDDGLMSSPYADGDWELWACLLLDTFGTRNFAVAGAFMRQLSAMLPKVWSEERRSNVVDVDRLQLALSIVCSLKPRNEAEAAIAVHCVALHLATYKVTEQMGSRSWLDPASAGALAAVTKAYAAQVQALQQMQRPNKSKRQTIKVIKNVTVNYRDEKHVHLPGGAGESATVPGAAPGRQLVPIPCGSGEAGLPDARGQGRRSEGGAER